jgi:hypothetical protein
MMTHAGFRNLAHRMLRLASAARIPRLFVWGTAAATGLGLLGMATNLSSLVLLS